MKQIFTLAATVLLALSLSTNVFAHSNMKQSNPANGDVITTPLKEIVIHFDGQIEQGSFIDVTTSSGQTIELQDTIIGDGKLTGTVAKPLPNDEYQVDWSIISKDGHPLEGHFSFTVDAPVSESTEQASKEATTIEKTTEAPSAEEGEKESSSTTIMLVVLLAVLAASGFFFIKRKK